MNKITKFNKKVIICGDIHGYWRPLNKLINKRSPTIILQCGDFGWWPRFHNTTCISSGEYEDDKGEIIDDPWKRMINIRVEKPWNQFGINNNKTKIYWCDGNHEDHWDLRNYIESPYKIMPFVYYMKRNSTLKLPDGRTVLFIGGANSIDRDSRILGSDWFPEEIISQRDITNLPDKEIDIVISHTCPMEFLEDLSKKLSAFYYRTDKKKDPSCTALSIVLEKYKPKLWYFGHFHVYYTGIYKETFWCCLNHSSNKNWWTYLQS